MPARKPIVRGAAALCAALLCAAAYLWLSTPLPALNRLRERAALGSTRVLDRQGRLLFEAPDPFGARRRPLPLAQIPLALRQAAVAVEDAGFYENRGIDLRGIARAAWQNARIGAVVSGGSTITQQLARAFLLDPALGQQRTAERKLREAVLALKIGAALSKDEVLELYLNQTYYGGMAYGVEPAARRLFAKPAAALDLAECALIAGLPQAPSRYDPLAGDAARAAAIARQHAVLDAMVREHYLSPAQAQAARAEALQFAGDDGALPPNQPAPHFVRYVLGQLAERLGPDAVARGGLVVTTTLDLDMQRAAEASLRRQLEQLSAPRDGEPDHKVRNGRRGGARPGHRRDSRNGGQPALRRRGEPGRGERRARAAPARLGDQAAHLRRRPRARLDARHHDPRRARRLPHPRWPALPARELRSRLPRPAFAARGPRHLVERRRRAHPRPHRRARPARYGPAPRHYFAQPAAPTTTGSRSRSAAAR